jgi:AAA15 family ATPase/GTPase
MLIEFSVSNFRSIRDTQTISMVAAPRLRKRENIFQPEVIGEKMPPLLKVAAIYGPNASGKSNLVRALGIVNTFTRKRPEAKLEKLPVASFRFDKALMTEPSRFELHFIQDRRRFSFVLAATTERIIEERLTEFPNGKEELLYSRSHTASGDHYEFGDQLEGGSSLHEAWKKLTSPQILFLAQAVANSSEELRQLRRPWEWLSNAPWCVSGGLQRMVKPVQSLMTTLPEFCSDIASLLQDVDIPVSTVVTRLVDSERADANDKIDSGNAIDQFTQLLSDPKSKFETSLTHTSALGSAEFSLSEESDGTKSLIGFALPWILIDKHHAIPMQLMVVDEMDSSLHPKIVEALVGRLIHSKLNAQLIFTTHDTHLMDSKLLRRDQYWLTERDQNGATKLRSIHDFEGRESEDIEKRYYEGRYRSLPILRAP